MADFNQMTYKIAYKKLYDAYVCKPPVGTLIINEIAHPDIVANLKGKTFFTVDELAQLEKTNPNFYNSIQGAVGKTVGKVTAEEPYVLAGSLGELYTISLANLKASFNLLVNGSDAVAITDDALVKKEKRGVMDWISLRSVSDSKKYSVEFIPLNMLQNDDSFHGHIAKFRRICYNINQERSVLYERAIMGDCGNNIYSSGNNDSTACIDMACNRCFYNYDCNVFCRHGIYISTYDFYCKLCNTACNYISAYKKISQKKLYPHKFRTQYRKKSRRY